LGDSSVLVDKGSRARCLHWTKKNFNGNTELCVGVSRFPLGNGVGVRWVGFVSFVGKKSCTCG
jgi:hypothetical protein